MQVKRAFTVVEILVVMAILMVLASILLPVFTKSKDAAKMTVCTSNLHQIYLAVELYSADFDGYPWHQPNHPVLAPYLGNQTLSCPVARALNKSNAPGDYENLANLAPEVQQFDPMFYDLYQECRLKRGGEFPIIVDSNRYGSAYTRLSNVPMILLARANGSIRRVPLVGDGWLSGPSIPCSPLLVFMNL